MSKTVVLTAAPTTSGGTRFVLGVHPSERVDRELLDGAGMAVLKDRPAPGEPAPNLPRDWAWWLAPSPYAAFLFSDYADAAAREALADVSNAVWLSRARDSLDDYPCPPGETYLPFQRAGIQYALAHQHVLIADEMGLGKTVQALGVANAIRAKTILIVCPASIRLQWLANCRRWLVGGGKRFIHPIMTAADGVASRADVTIISYDLARNEAVWGALMARTYDLTILDEAHYLKNHGAARTRAVLGGWNDRPGVVDRSKKIVALTGTPLPNRPKELYPLIRAIAWHAIDKMTAGRFIDTYNPEIRRRGVVVGHDTRRLLELQIRLRANVMIRRTKAEVATELPPKTYEIIEVEKTGRIKKALEAESLLAIDPLRVSRLSMEEQAKVAAVRREMGIAKAPLVVQHLMLLLEGGAAKLVVFCWHRDVVSAIAAGLASHEIQSVALTGSTPGAQRMRLVEAFVGQPEIRVFVAQLIAGGTGIDGLQRAASIAVFAECSWSFGENEQAADRLHRGGQALPVTVQFLVAPGSLDARVLTAALRKCRVADMALDKR